MCVFCLCSCGSVCTYTHVGHYIQGFTWVLGPGLRSTRLSSKHFPSQVAPLAFDKLFSREECPGSHFMRGNRGSFSLLGILLLTRALWEITLSSCLNEKLWWTSGFAGMPWQWRHVTLVIHLALSFKSMFQILLLWLYELYKIMGCIILFSDMRIMYLCLVTSQPLLPFFFLDLLIQSYPLLPFVTRVKILGGSQEKKKIEF